MLIGSITCDHINLCCRFYVTYIIFSIPGTLLAKAILPSTAIALGCLIWSVGASGMAGAHSYASIIVCRLFIGIGESLFSQSVALHYSLWSVALSLNIRVESCVLILFLKGIRRTKLQNGSLFSLALVSRRVHILTISKLFPDLSFSSGAFGKRLSFFACLYSDALYCPQGV